MKVSGFCFLNKGCSVTECVSTLLWEHLNLSCLLRAFCLLSVARSRHPQPPFWVAIKGRRIKGRVHRHRMLVAFLFPPTYVPVLQDFYDKHHFPQHRASWFPTPQPAQPILTVSLSAESLHHAGYQKPQTLLVTSPSMTAEAQRWVFIIKRPEKIKGLCLRREWND